MDIRLSKSLISEIYLRKALYWLSKDCLWEFEQSEDEWIIRIVGSTSPEKHQAVFNRYLNDFILRERLDRKTGELRDQIIQKALTDIKELM